MPTCQKKKACKRDWGGDGDANEVGRIPGQQTVYIHLFWAVSLTMGNKDRGK